MSKLPETPELDKVSAVKAESQSIGAFLDWLGDAPQLITSDGEGRAAAVHATKIKNSPVQNPGSGSRSANRSRGFWRNILTLIFPKLKRRKWPS